MFGSRVGSTSSGSASRRASWRLCTASRDAQRHRPCVQATLYQTSIAPAVHMTLIVSEFASLGLRRCRLVLCEFCQDCLLCTLYDRRVHVPEECIEFEGDRDRGDPCPSSDVWNAARWHHQLCSRTLCCRVFAVTCVPGFGACNRLFSGWQCAGSGKHRRLARLPENIGQA